ncbi:MAG: RNA methyltransferase [Acidimicrobiia bacterium]|nr:RNA methyltransferase [Acidimicrobiia bacterium]
MKRARSLAGARQRRAGGLVLLEGRRLIRSAAEAGVEFELFTCDAEDDLAAFAVESFVVDAHVLREIATTVHPQDVVAVARWAPDRTVPRGVVRAVVLCRMSDPGNVGTIVRTAAALGVDAVVTTRGSCDLTNPKVLRASAGAVFSVGLGADLDSDDVFEYLGSRLPHVAAVSAGGELPARVRSDCRNGFVLWLGSEAHGLGSEILERAGCAVTIPLSRPIESLNAATAGAILLWELCQAT